MPLLQVRNIPEELYKRLSQVAHTENRSIAQETVVLLRSALNQKQERSARRKAVIEEIRNLDLGKTKAFPDPAGLIREDRER
ncbi:MAG: hypothetical protein ABSF77_01085 [Spirochaetia bacterium]